MPFMTHDGPVTPVAGHGAFGSFGTDPYGLVMKEVPTVTPGAEGMAGTANPPPKEKKAKR